MNRNQAKELLPFIQAFVEGKPIQYRMKDIKSAKWNDIDKNYHEFSPHSFQYRIKPGPKYRPFTNVEECWEEMLKHQPFGWVKSIDNKDSEVFIHCTAITKEDGILTGIDEIPFPYCGMFNNYTFADGTPFGIKVEE